MRLLVDENISFKLSQKIKHLYPIIHHVSDLNLNKSTDAEIWEFAKINNYTIVTFDSDFIDLSLLNGYPPKVIWLKTGNISTENLATKFKMNFISIKHLIESDELAFLEIE